LLIAHLGKKNGEKLLQKHVPSFISPRVAFQGCGEAANHVLPEACIQHSQCLGHLKVDLTKVTYTDRFVCLVNIIMDTVDISTNPAKMALTPRTPKLTSSGKLS